MFILTFDLEEWFHILDIGSLEDNKRWDSFETRIYQSTYRIVETLKKNNLTATFFVLGWIAEKYPDLVRLISDLGHEIGSHSLNHILVYKTSQKVFRQDLKKSIDIIHNITNKKVRAFRAPGFSIKKDTSWAFEILAEEGIEIDSSVFPASRGHGGIKNFPIDHPFRIRVNGRIIKEFPINVFRVGNYKIPFSGGGYFRAIPSKAIVYFSNRSDYFISYFHPREFDPDQPVIHELPLIRRFKSYYGLKKFSQKFERIIKKYDFMDLYTAERILNWDELPLMTM